MSNIKQPVSYGRCIFYNDESKIKELLGERLSLFRKKSNLTVEELSKRSGVSEKTITRMEEEYDKYEYVTSLSIIIKLANGLDIDFRDLFY